MTGLVSYAGSSVLPSPIVPTFNQGGTICWFFCPGSPSYNPNSSWFPTLPDAPSFFSNLNPFQTASNFSIYTILGWVILGVGLILFVVFMVRISPWLKRFRVARYIVQKTQFKKMRTI
jgi:hypothetical protein